MLQHFTNLHKTTVARTSLPIPSVSALRRDSSPGRWNVLFFSIGILAFAVGSTVGVQFHSSFLLLGYAGAFLMLAVSLTGWIKGHHAITPEIRLMWYFCLWAILTGAIMAKNYDLYFKGAERIIQIAAVAFCVAGFCARLRSPALGLGSILSVALLLGIYSSVTGDFDSIGDITYVNANKVKGVRAMSMVGNTNSLGVTAVWGLVAVTYFSGTTKRLWLRLLLWGCSPILFVSMIASASRKALLLPVIYLIAWFWFCHRKWILRRWQSSLPILAIIAILGLGLPWVLANTFAGYRLQRALDTDHQDASTETRLIMAKEALEITTKYPVTGVGLSQWSLYASVGAYAHSEYAELAATTGIIGIMLFISPFILASRRLWQIRRINLPEDEHYRAGVCLALLFTIAFAGFGQVLFSSQSYWVLVGSVWGYAFGASQTPVATPRNTVHPVRSGVFPNRYFNKTILWTNE